MKYWKILIWPSIAAGVVFLSFVIKGYYDADTNYDKAQIIEPGKNIGKYFLGANRFLSPIKEDLKNNHIKNLGLHLTYDNNHNVQSIVSLRPNFITKEGIKVGSTEKEVKSIFGDPITTSLIRADGEVLEPVLVYEGIYFMMEAEKVQAVVVSDMRPLPNTNE